MQLVITHIIPSTGPGPVFILTHNYSLTIATFYHCKTVRSIDRRDLTNIMKKSQTTSKQTIAKNDAYVYYYCYYFFIGIVLIMIILIVNMQHVKPTKRTLI